MNAIVSRLLLLNKSIKLSIRTRLLQHLLAGRNEMKWNKKGSKSEKEEEKKKKENQIHTYNKQIEKKIKEKKKERLNPWLEP